jgi:hypothetical protein
MTFLTPCVSVLLNFLYIQAINRLNQDFQDSRIYRMLVGIVGFYLIDSLFKIG